MEEYRTEQQFVEVCESVMNGNWSQAAEECDEYGLYANDMVGYQEDYEEQGISIISMADIAILMEMASEYRFTTDKRWTA